VARLSQNAGGISCPLIHLVALPMIELSAGADVVDEVHLPDKALWLGEYLGELATFPNGRNDDQVDSTSQGLGWFKNRESRDSFGLVDYAKKHLADDC
jgi:hypothetical protein